MNGLRMTLALEWIRADQPNVWLTALVAVPLIACVWLRKRRTTQMLQLAEVRHLHRLFPMLGPAADVQQWSGQRLLGWLRRRMLLRGLFGAAAMLLFAAAYFGPVRGHALVPVQSREIDVMVVLDSSRSMWTEDVTPNRLERAKVEIKALFDAMRGERVGLIAFAGLARSISPLTRDVDTARYFLDRVSPERNRKGGTDIGAALRLALDRFEEGTGSHQAIVLVTDGEDLTGEGLEAAEAAAERDIRVHVLGMGTETGGKIPDGTGGFIVDPTSSAGDGEVVSKLAPDTLRAIADASDGVYLQAKGRVLPLEELYERAIADIEGRDITDGKERVPMDRYQWLLGLALAFALLETALRETRRARRGTGPLSQESEA